MDKAGFTRWLDAYKAAWETGGPSQIVPLFTADAIYQETPFEEPMRGREAIRQYWQDGAQEAQRGVAFTYEIYAIDGDIGLCHWHCAFERVPSGERVELDGVFRCVFAADGKCRHFQDWWHRRTV